MKRSWIPGVIGVAGLSLTACAGTRSVEPDEQVGQTMQENRSLEQSGLDRADMSQDLAVNQGLMARDVGPDQARIGQTGSMVPGDTSGSVGAEPPASARSDIPGSSAVGGVATDRSRLDQAIQVQPIDLNSATLEQLRAIPGMDEILASRIIAYRDRAGQFSDVNDLLFVQGMTRDKLEKLKPYVKVDSEAGTMTP